MTEAHSVLTQTQLYATTIAAPFLVTCMGTTDYNNAASSAKVGIAVSKEAACTAKQLERRCLNGNAPMVAKATEAASQFLDQNPAGFCLMLEQGDKLLIRDALPTLNCGFSTCDYPDSVGRYGAARHSNELASLSHIGNMAHALSQCESRLCQNRLIFDNTVLHSFMQGAAGL